MRYYLRSLTFLLFPILALSQPGEQAPIPAASAYIEIFGHNLAYSINYDRIIDYHYKYLDGFNIGLTPYVRNFSMSGMTAVSAGYYRLYGQSNKFVEAGGGLNTYFHFNSNSTNYLGAYFAIGYRNQGAFRLPVILRVTFTPLIVFGFDSNHRIYVEMFGPWAGISIGNIFQKKKISREMKYQVP